MISIPKNPPPEDPRMAGRRRGTDREEWIEVVDLIYPPHLRAHSALPAIMESLRKGTLPDTEDDLAHGLNGHDLNRLFADFAQDGQFINPLIVMEHGRANDRDLRMVVIGSQRLTVAKAHQFEGKVRCVVRGMSTHVKDIVLNWYEPAPSFEETPNQKAENV